MKTKSKVAIYPSPQYHEANVSAQLVGMSRPGASNGDDVNLTLSLEPSAVRGLIKLLANDLDKNARTKITFAFMGGTTFPTS